MNHRNKCIVCLAILVMLSDAASPATTARADLMGIGTSLTLSWDRGVNPSGSRFMTIPILNPSSSTAQLEDWNLAIRVVGETGSTGTLAINTSTIAYPTTGSILPSGDRNPSTKPSVVPVTGLGTSPGDVQVFANVPLTSATGSYPVPVSGDSLFTLQFSSTDAVGTFDLYAFNRSSGLASYWTDNSDTSRQWNSIGAGSPATNQLLIGTITVTATPEPGSLALAGLAVAAFAGRRLRYRRVLLAIQ